MGEGRALRETLSGRAFCPASKQDSMFSLKGRFSEDISSGTGDSVSRAIFHSGRAARSSERTSPTTS